MRRLFQSVVVLLSAAIIAGAGFVARTSWAGKAGSPAAGQRKASQMGKSASSDRTNGPDYLQRWPGLFIREGDRIVDAPPEDVEVAKRYPAFANKGAVVGDRRITIMCRADKYRVGEQVRVLHVLEALKPGQKLFVMGPKAVYGEYVDDRLATAASADPAQAYDGRVLDSPGVDYNYDITHYSFSEPGRHKIYWQMGELRSNTLEIEVVYP
jgi:hypothetical protein